MGSITPFKKYLNGNFIFQNSYSTSSVITFDMVNKLRNLDEAQIFLNKDNELLIEIKKGKANDVNIEDKRISIISDILYKNKNNINKNVKKQLNSQKICFMNDCFEINNLYGRIFLIKNLGINDVKSPINAIKNDKTAISIHLKKVYSERILNIIDNVEVADEYKLSLPSVKENLEKSLHKDDPLYLIDIEVLVLAESKEELERLSLELKYKSKESGYQLSELYYQQKNGLYNVLPYGKNFLSVERTLSLSEISKIGGWIYDK